jgi:hypothetical protein
LSPATLLALGHLPVSDYFGIRRGFYSRETLSAWKQKESVFSRTRCVDPCPSK